MNTNDNPDSTRPKVIVLCGSSRYPDFHMRAMMAETLRGNIVIPLGLYGHADYPPGALAATRDGDESDPGKQMLDTLHFAKIDLADEILVVNAFGYVGPSTSREIEYARKAGKIVRYAYGGGFSPPQSAASAQSADHSDPKL